jgi:hypothetical protein
MANEFIWQEIAEKRIIFWVNEIDLLFIKCWNCSPFFDDSFISTESNFLHIIEEMFGNDFHSHHEV